MPRPKCLRPPGPRHLQSRRRAGCCGCSGHTCRRRPATLPTGSDVPGRCPSRPGPGARGRARPGPGDSDDSDEPGFCPARMTRILRRGPGSHRISRFHPTKKRIWPIGAPLDTHPHRRCEVVPDQCRGCAWRRQGSAPSASQAQSLPTATRRGTRARICDRYRRPRQEWARIECIRSPIEAADRRLAREAPEPG